MTVSNQRQSPPWRGLRFVVIPVVLFALIYLLQNLFREPIGDTAKNIGCTVPAAIASTVSEYKVLHRIPIAGEYVDDVEDFIINVTEFVVGDTCQDVISEWLEGEGSEPPVNVSVVEESVVPKANSNTCTDYPVFGTFVGVADLDQVSAGALHTSCGFAIELANRIANGGGNLASGASFAVNDVFSPVLTSVPVGMLNGTGGFYTMNCHVNYSIVCTNSTSALVVIH